MNHIANNIASLRKIRKLTQEELATRAGIPINYVGKIECGKVQRIGIKSLSRIAQVLNATPTDLCNAYMMANFSNEFSERTWLYEHFKLTLQCLRTSLHTQMKLIEEIEFKLQILSMDLKSDEVNRI